MPGRGLKNPAPHETGETRNTTGPSWEFFNPEVERLVKELAQEKKALALREQQLNELATRLEAERAEITTVTQAVHRLQQEFDRGVLRIREEETANLKKLAKVYATMTPEGAVTILRQMEDEQIVKFMVFMKDGETAPLLENFARQGEAEAKRAAAIMERLRTATYRNAPPKTPNP
jgi:flagellar motility protein MotE (MotC chaperone)